MDLEAKRITLGLEVKQVEEDDKFFTFTGIASTGDLDLGRDRVAPGAFTETLADLRRRALPIPDLPGKQRLLPALWQHDMRAPIGSFIDMQESSTTLSVEAVMPKSDTFVSGRVVPQMRGGSIGGLSIGYIAEEFEFESDGEVRVLNKVRLLETSLVTIPMNPNAIITDVKAKLPFLNIDQLNSSSERELENLLKSGVSTSAETAKHIVHALKALNREEERQPRDVCLQKANKLLDDINLLFN